MTESKTKAKKETVSSKEESLGAENIATVEKQPVKTETKTKYKVKKDLNPNTIVTVYNGYHGKLVYTSKKTGETLVWSEIGGEQDMELQELKNAKNSSKVFFERNWFLIDDPEILEYLGVEKYYKNSLTSDTLNELFEKSASEIEEVVTKLPEGQKKTVAYLAKQRIADESLDSLNIIRILEKALSVQLIEN